jgi:hypothetical protein
MSAKVIKLFVENGEIKQRIEENTEKEHNSNKLTFVLTVMDNDGEIVASENFRATWTLNDTDPLEYGSDENTKTLLCDIFKNQLTIDLKKTKIIENLVDAILETK